MALVMLPIDFGTGGGGSVQIPERWQPKCPGCGKEVGQGKTRLTIYTAQVVFATFDEKGNKVDEKKRAEMRIGVVCECGVRNQPPLTDMVENVQFEQQ